MGKMNKKSSTNDLNSFILFRRSLIYQTKEFFGNSTLHGIRYIAENGRSLCDKFMWFCFSIIALVTALIIIMSLWEKFQTNPTITGLETDFSIDQVIFPTVTVCPKDTLDEELAFALASNLTNYDNTTRIIEEIIPFFNILTKLNFGNIKDILKLTESLKDIISLNDINLRVSIFQVIKPIDKIMNNCTFKGKTYNCDEIFYPIYTEKGLCYAFNSRFKSTPNADLNDTAIKLFEKHDTDSSLLFHPKQLSNILITPREEYFGTNIQNEFTFEEFSIQVLVALKSTYTIEATRQLSIKQRKCIFSDEIKLELFEEDYSLSGCIITCRLKKSMKLCNCIPPFYRPTKSYPICNITDLNCLDHFKYNITTISSCNYCELNCQEDVFRIDRYERLDHVLGGIAKIALLGWPLIRYRREVLFGWTDLFVSFGGIAGLFLGFSMLSGVEILFYFTIRSYCMLYKNREELYALETDIMRKSIPKINMSLISNKHQKQNKSESIKLKVFTRLNNNNIVPMKSSSIRNKVCPIVSSQTHHDEQHGFLEWYQDRLRYRTEQLPYLP